VNTVINATIDHTALVGGLRNHVFTDDRTDVLDNAAMHITKNPTTEEVTSRL
jgi:hypothetical protein